MGNPDKIFWEVRKTVNETLETIMNMKGGYFLKKIMVQRMDLIPEDRNFKTKIFNSFQKEARKSFNEFKDEWNNKYSKAIYNMETKLHLLLIYYKQGD